jgi:Ni,Fe-hydrogenase I large subunit
VFDNPASADYWCKARGTFVAELIAQLAGERPSFAASEVALLPADGEVVARAVGNALDANPTFEREPSWQGEPAETGSLARVRSQPWVAATVVRSGHSALARLIARVVELVALIRPDTSTNKRVAGAVSIAPGTGLGWVETARGLLVHAVEIAAGAVRRYRIIAPTEWNFHPRGALTAGLVGVTTLSEDDLRRLLRLAVESLDPCVAYRVEVALA